MPTYRATALGFLPGNRRQEPGSVFSWDGPVGSWMEPADGETAPPSAGPAGESLRQAHPTNKAVDAAVVLSGPGPDAAAKSASKPPRRKPTDTDADEGGGETDAG